MGIAFIKKVVKCSLLVTPTNKYIYEAGKMKITDRKRVKKMSTARGLKSCVISGLKLCTRYRFNPELSCKGLIHL